MRPYDPREFGNGGNLGKGSDFASGYIAVESLVPDHLLSLVGNVRAHSGQSFQGLEGLLIAGLNSGSAEYVEPECLQFMSISTKCSVIFPFERRILKSLCRNMASRCFSSNAGATRNRPSP